MNSNIHMGNPRNTLTLQTLVAFGLNLLFIISCASADFKADETGINGVKAWVEQIESSKAYRPDKVTHKIGQAKKELFAHLKSRPNDIEALILSARLGIIERLSTPILISKGKEPRNPKELSIPQYLNLDRALKLQPDNAEAHYWKARLYGISSPTIGEDGRLVKNPIDLDKATHFARKAVELDPKNVRYREALATYLIIDQRRKEALEVMDIAFKERHPTYILLKDLESFPVPEGAINSKKDSDSFRDRQMSQGRIVNYPQLRVQVYIMPMPVSEIEAFYQRQWPKFKFFRQGPRGPFAQYMIFEAGGLRPATSFSEIEKLGGKTDGILLSAMEIRNPTEKQRKETPAGHSLPSSLGEVFSYVFYVNSRHLD